ncbi:PIN domain-containing protein [Rugamonas sp.]|uniref:PIN domain-containing protein n=1 Tax=Rugamonas sp. TaxID=1926287 RepID=UPI0025D422F7|nr:type II toxin-antitoxin system VapC family toxin [Rugamonas sp.]
MISVDTNVLIRYLVRDDATQYELARRCIEDHAAPFQPALVTLLVMMESEWVLRSAYKVGKPDIADMFTSLLAMRDFAVEQPLVLNEALLLWKNKSVNFANCLILARGKALGCDAMATFDIRASKLPGCILLKA